MSKVQYFKDYHAITIHGWMISKLGLTGNKLLVYALIFQFSSIGEAEFYGEKGIFCELCSCKSRTVDDILNELVSDRLIYMSELEYKGKKHRTYRVNLKKVYACLHTKKTEE